MILHPHATSSHSPQRPHTGRALVTGGAGFVGSHIAEALLQAGWRVLVVDDLTTGREGNVPAGAELAVADIRSEAFESAIHSYRPDLVTHAAAQASVAISVSNPAVDASVNIVGGLRVAESAIASGARQFVYINTGGALYGAPRYLPVDEDHPVVPLSPYGLAKWTLECYLRLVLEPRMPLKVLRLANVYGPRQDPSGEAGVVAVFADAMLNDAPVTIHGDGEQTRDFVFVEDVARAHQLAVAQRDSLTVNVSSGAGTTVNQLFDKLAGATGYRREPAYGPARAGDVRHSILSNQRARATLGWQPEVSLQAGIGATCDWLRLDSTAHPPMREAGVAPSGVGVPAQ